MSRRSLPSAASRRSTTICVAMPAWSVPGCHSASRPCMRRQRTSDVLDGERQRVAHVQAAGDVRRRDHDGERLRVGARVAGEAAGAFPSLVQAGSISAGANLLSSVIHLSRGGACVPLRSTPCDCVDSASRKTSGAACTPEASVTERALRYQGTGAADDPLDFCSDQTLHQRRQVDVQPFLQQRPQFGSHDILQRRAAWNTPAWLGRPPKCASGCQPTDAAAAAASGATQVAASSPERMRQRLRPARAASDLQQRNGRRRCQAAAEPVPVHNRIGLGPARHSGHRRHPRRHHHGLVQHQHIVFGGRCLAGSAAPPGTRPRSGCGGWRLGSPPSTGLRLPAPGQGGRCRCHQV